MERRGLISSRSMAGGRKAQRDGRLAATLPLIILNNDHRARFNASFLKVTGAPPSKRSLMKTKILLGLAVVGISALATQAKAGVSVGFHFGLPIPPLPVPVIVAPPVPCAPPVVFAPAPVVVAPAPCPPRVIVAPPVFYRPAIVVPHAYVYRHYHGYYSRR
jgi:hypothetical protein